VYLLDTNVILELLLDQERADDVERLLLETEAKHLHLSEFAFYSLGIVLRIFLVFSLLVIPRKIRQILL
jgi:uncharacterized protein